MYTLPFCSYICSFAPKVTYSNKYRIKSKKCNLKKP